MLRQPLVLDESSADARSTCKLVERQIVTNCNDCREGAAEVVVLYIR
jgi:hypothetical protein